MLIAKRGDDCQGNEKRWLPEQEGGLDGEAGEEDADDSQPKRLIMEVKVGGNDIANIVQSSFFKLQSQMMK